MRIETLCPYDLCAIDLKAWAKGSGGYGMPEILIVRQVESNLLEEHSVPCFACSFYGDDPAPHLLSDVCRTVPLPIIRAQLNLVGTCIRSTINVGTTSASIVSAVCVSACITLSRRT
jgi:hypothetical protein